MRSRRYICSSYTISGTMPGGAVASRHGFAERVAACAEAGYAGMCLHFRDYLEQRERGWRDEDMRAVLAAGRMDYLSIEFLTDWFMDGQAGELARSNEETAFQAARALGARIIHVGPDLSGRGVAGLAMRLKFRELCKRAARHGLMVALEPVAWGNVRDIDTALGIIDDIANAGLVLDCWHFFRAGLALDEMKKIPMGRILAVQINDADSVPVGGLAVDTMNRKLCGQGSFELERFVATLDEMGVAVPLSIEIISTDMVSRPAAEAAALSLTSARNCLRGLG